MKKIKILPDNDLSNKYGILGKILSRNNLKTEEEINNFLNFDYQRDFLNPNLPDINLGISRIIEAFRKNEKILIYGDYDVDGICASVLLADFFRLINFKNYFNKIPLRNSDGYGLSKSVLENLDQKPDLIITVDCGSNDLEVFSFLAEKNIDLIVTDHHQIDIESTNLIALINPQKSDSVYKNKNLSGCAVAYKLIEALNQSLAQTKIKDIKSIPDKYLFWSLDLVAISLIADLMKLEGENRSLAHYGLLVLRKTKRIGLRSIFYQAFCDLNKVNETDIAFTLCPQINAASRLGDAQIVFDLLFTQDKSQAQSLAKELKNINARRKKTLALMTKSAYKKLKLKEGQSIIVIGSKDWLPGFCGLLASKLVDNFSKPSFVWGLSDRGEIKGSCRSYGNFNIYNFLQNNKNLFLNFGGHKFCGGFSLNYDNLLNFENQINQQKIDLNPNSEEEYYDIVSRLELSEISHSLLSDLNKAAPFGLANPQPLFLMEEISFESLVYFSENQHLKVILNQQSNFQIEIIKFFITSEEKDFLSNKKKLSFICTIDKDNSLRKNVSRNLKLKVLKFF